MERNELAAVLKATARVLHRHYNSGPVLDEGHVGELWHFYGGMKADWKQATGRDWIDGAI